MNIEPVLVAVRYFGKIPSRGDFVKSAGQHQLVASLDQWLAQGMELLAQDVRWKLTYESIQPMRFAFVGPRSRFVVAGHMRASSDLSARRFPFISVVPFETEAPVEFMQRSPLALNGAWSRLETLTNDLFKSEESTSALNALGASSVPVDLEFGACDAYFKDFLQTATLSSLSALLRQSGYEISLRRLFLALGVLLQPVLTSGASHLERGLLLPLPLDPFQRTLVSGLWMRLIAPFMTRADFELALFDGMFMGKPALAIGFSGASPRTLQSVFDPEVCNDHNIRLEDADWVEPYLDNHYGLSKFSSYLDQERLSLRVAVDTFCETFLGA